MLKSIAVAKGDGIGSEIMDVVIDVFQQLEVPLEYKYIDMGKDIFLQGHKLGMTPQAQKTVEELGILFKGPMETPKGGGNRSINVTARKMWSTFANCRTFKTLPGVETIYSKMGIPINLTIIRENLEDTYGGVEHLITADLAIARRFISAPGSYKVHKYAFEYAKQQGLKSVVCAHKANIMKITDGMFLEVFYELAKEYPEIKASDVIIDDLCMKLVTIPNQYELIVLPNLQGDIVSDLCAGLVGGLGFAPSANIGNNIKIFEAVHGTAPDKVGQNVANPTALLMSGLMMLNFLGFTTHAKKIEMALIQTLQAKIHTADLKVSNSPVSTTEYGKAIVAKAKAISNIEVEKQIGNAKAINLSTTANSKDSTMLTMNKTKDKCIGIDVFIESIENTKTIVSNLEKLDLQGFKLDVISNRGTNVYPNFSKYSECINSYTLRFLATEIKETQGLEFASLLANHYKILSVEFLREYEGKLGFSII